MTNPIPCGPVRLGRDRDNPAGVRHHGERRWHGFKYLESRDVDVVGNTLRNASLMTDPENDFDDHDPFDCRLFAIRYLILPAADQPPCARGF